VTEYLAPIGANRCRISRLNKDDSLTFLGEYGYGKGIEGTNFSSKEWRSWKHDEALIALDVIEDDWNSSKSLSVIKLRDHGAIQGFMSLGFTNPVEDLENANSFITGYGASISLYLSLARESKLHHSMSGNSTFTGEREPAALTKRQIQILSGMVAEKTNLQLAKELGYSVSTIRHETMRIYEALAVSDRKEAAEKAVELSLI
jgi:DNA-binding CsgD family transcriptional regulator